MRRLLVGAIAIFLGGSALVVWAMMPKRPPPAPPHLDGPHQPGLAETVFGALIPHSH